MSERGISGQPGCVNNSDIHVVACLGDFLSSDPRFGRFRAVFQPNMRLEYLVVASTTDRATLWHALGAPR
jgi:hypothetical protein